MNTSIPNKHLAFSDNHNPNYIVTHWFEAIAHFQEYYFQLVTCISQRVIEPELKIDGTPYIGQCPLSQLVKLIGRMELELAKLSQDMDQVGTLKQSTQKKIYNKLASHTYRLNQLNNQAQTRLYLVKRSAS